MRLEVTKMTPAMASEILARSAGQRNRRLSATRVRQLTDAIIRGQWMLNHQAIALDEAGALIDGQHRLAAIVAADTPVDVLVAYDADPATFHTLDLRGARRTSDVLHIAGHVDVNVLAAAARMLLLMPATIGRQRVPSPAERAAITNTDVLELVESERGARLEANVRRANGICQGLGRMGAKTPLSVVLTMIQETGASDGLIEEFFGRLDTGAMISPAMPVFALRRWFTQSYDSTLTQYRPWVVYGITVKAWNAYLRGERMSVATQRIGKDVFLAPAARELVDA